MHINTRAIVLHSTKYSETSIISKMFTEEMGVVSYMINGIRSTKGKNKAVLFQPATILEIQATQRENKSLQRLVEYKRYCTYESIPFDIRKTAVVQLLIEMLNRAISQTEANEELFLFIVESLLHIDKCHELNPDFHLIFLLKLTALFGFQPNGNYTSLTPLFDLKEGCYVSKAVLQDGVACFPHSSFISNLNAMEITEKISVIPNGKERNVVLQYLLQYFKYHIANFGNLKSPEVLKTIFE